MRSILTRRVPVVIAAVALMGLGIPAAQAQTSYGVCATQSETIYCLYPETHGSITYVSDEGEGDITFINKYVTANGNAWSEVQAGGLCLNWSLADNNTVYWDSCQPGDPNELFYNHVKGQLISLAGNEFYDADSYLQPDLCGVFICELEVSTAKYTGWLESAAN